MPTLPINWLDRGKSLSAGDSPSYPVVAVTGPRQSGKTTLCRHTFPDHAYVTLEAQDVNAYARSDPRGFLGEFAQGAILDEIQNAPELLGYIQERVDRDPARGRFVLTGSQHFGLTAQISQSLAGRVGIARLLPPSFDKLSRFKNAPADLFATLWSGSYPRIFDAEIPPEQWLRDYFSTYVQRDVRQVMNVGDLTTFSTFVRVCAGRTACEANLSGIASDVGVSHHTIGAWLSVLETSFLTLQIPSFHANVRKKSIKAPKMHFVDSGLVCWLLGIRSPTELRHHPLRGAIFESWVASELYKLFAHSNLDPQIHHYRAARGVEIDLILDAGAKLGLVEVKSGATIDSSYFKAFEAFRESGEFSNKTIETFLVYGGVAAQSRTSTAVVPWRSIRQVFERVVAV
ncbi:MAG: ATP-binding protein [Planctomycetota bacterium]